MKRVKIFTIFLLEDFMKNRSMPESSIIPVLGYENVPKAVEWLCRVFGFVERLRIGEHRAQLIFGNGAIVVAGRHSDVHSTDSIMMRAENIDSHCEHARQNGARILYPPDDYAYGERQYTAEDLDGHIWTFSQTSVDVDPKEWGGLLFE
jgi:uncharacterized glyoxalase superfamily protein PhnB